MPLSDLRTIRGTGRLVTFELLHVLVLAGGIARTDQGDTTAADDALFDRGLGGGDRILDAVLLLLEFHFGCGADLQNSDTSAQLGQALLELLAIVVGVGVLDLGSYLAGCAR